ncbi:CRISPR-associated helicase Cas3' [Thermococcus sp. SY098]|uniref:CRISPR-associated helicase Cas3' n=1 Tax=Thermococcus sp. SY098 TaxID=3111325 RepID=UPI002D78F954|nr:CRISPR-associated helicase Cas3' [Thermococcus sp. SY098]WRS52688.1 CRISPR-associated helicase Cas3' [Thermococcus sp. SY098]
MSQVTIDEFLKRENKNLEENTTSKLFRLLKAKSGDKDALLIDHVNTALRRCAELYEFIERLGSAITYEPLRDPEKRNVLFKGLAKAIILHDLGKITLDFQRKLYGKEFPEELKELLEGSGNIKARHEILSILWSTGLLGHIDEDAKIRAAVLLHHYNEFFSEDKEFSHIVELYPDDVEKYLDFLVSKKRELGEFLDDYLRTIESEFNEDFIRKALAEIKPDFSRIEALKEKVETWDDDLSESVPIYNPEELDVDFLVFLGMLRRCDYSASGDFPIETVLDISKVFRDIEERIRERIEKKLRKTGLTLEELWQKKLLNRKDSDYLVVVAPTGSGKTELGVLWAKSRGKLVYTLPLRVALNDLYRRLSEEYFDNESVGLLHSTAFMEYIEGAGSDIKVEKKVNSAGLLAMPVMLSTPDQVFLTSLNYYGSDKVISVYPESCIVVDEVQAYTPEMAAVFLKTLQLIKRAGGKVLVITATLPPHIEHFLRREGFEIVDVLEEARRHGVNVKNLHLKRHLVKLVEGDLFRYTDEGVKFEGIKDVLSAIIEFEECGFRSVMVVLNNVKKAIEAYKSISGRVKGWEVYLLHSRLPEKKKAEVVLEVKSNLEEGKRVVLIATQVVEASVDLDFDAMITEISPIDSQIQRWGRVYRNRKTDYEGDVPNIIVFSGVDRGTTAVYGRNIGARVLQKTIEVINSLEGKTLDYEAERNAINEVYHGEILEKYKGQIEELLTRLDYFTLEKQSEAQRVFRQMAGMYFVVPALMIEYGYSETVKKFGELLSDPKNFRLSWSDITQKLSQELEYEVSKWELRKILQEFSVNIPIWFVFKDGNLQHALHNTFKGYPVVLTWDKKIAEKLWEYGVDKVIDKDLDVEGDIL